MKDERSSDLNRRLRAGDPYDGEAGLTTEEVRTMRRTVLTAVPEPRRRLIPGLALAGAVIVAFLIAVIALWPGSGGSPRPQPPRIAGVPTPPVRNRRPEAESQTAATAQPLPAPTTEKSRPPLRRHRRPPAGETTAPHDTLAALNPPVPEEGTAIREIQFSTPGGTRIIWTLTPGKTSF